MDKFTEATLRNFLNSHGVDTKEWGTRAFKSVNKLLEGIEKGEMALRETKDGGVECIVNACSADVYFKDPEGILWKLKEEKRIIINNKESVRVKIREGENPKETIHREIQEELNIPESGYKIKFLRTGNHEGVSTNYPNLFSKFSQHYFEVFLKKDYFKKDGYVEEQPTCSIYFIWEKINKKI